MPSFQKLILRFASDRSGATAIEYGMLAGLITAAIIVSIRYMGTSTTSKFIAVAGNLS